MPQFQLIEAATGTPAEIAMQVLIDECHDNQGLRQDCVDLVSDYDSSWDFRVAALVENRTVVAAATLAISDTLKVARVFVKPKWRGQQYGRRVIEELFKTTELKPSDCSAWHGTEVRHIGFWDKVGITPFILQEVAEGGFHAIPMTDDVREQLLRTFDGVKLSTYVVLDPQGQLKELRNPNAQKGVEEYNG